MALRSQRTNHVLHCEYTSTGENLPFLEEEYEICLLFTSRCVSETGTVGYYFMPKKFGKNVKPSEVDHINVFDGNTGTVFTITDSEDIEYIVANIQCMSMKRDGISLGRTGYSFKICLLYTSRCV